MDTQLVQNSEFLIITDQVMYEFLQEIAMEMQKFGCSRAEAVARINEMWGGMVIKDPDLITHELAEHWAHWFYFGDVPYWEETADRTAWKIKEAPPKESTSWTLKE